MLRRLLLAGLLVAARGESLRAEDEPRPSLQAEIGLDLRAAEDGWLPVSMRYAPLPPGEQVFKLMGSEPELSYRGFAAQGLDGRELELRRKEGLLYTDPGGSGGVVLSYEARPGGPGRHGHQGWADAEFAVFDGRIFLLPQASGQLDDALLRFQLPGGWSVASPFEPERDGYRVPGGEAAAQMLWKSCMAVGPFELRSQRLGSTSFQVHAYAPWEEAHRELLGRKSFALAQWFQRELGFDPGGRFAVVWTPQPDKQRVYGGSWSNGTCFEHPADRLRNWELLAHRMGHALNRYHPSGMLLRDARDHWFEEGWASYLEVAATVGAGLAADERAFDELYGRYLRIRRQHPERVLPLAREPEATGDARDFLHYVKGPLTVRVLAHWLRQRTGRSLEEFMAASIEEHGSFRSAFPLRDDLEAFAGQSFQDFFALMADGPGVVVPVWRGEQAARSTPQPAAGRADGEPVSGDYLHHLAASGDFARFADIADFVAQETRRRRQLRLPEGLLYPAQWRRELDRLDPELRYAMARSEEAYERVLGQPQRTRRSAGCGGGPRSNGPQPSLQLDEEQEDGRAFAELLRLERAYEAARGTRAASSLELRAGDGDDVASAPARLGLRKAEKAAAVTRWRWIPAEPQLEILRDGESVGSRKIKTEPGWSRTWTHVEPAQRGGGAGVLVFRLRDSRGALLERGFWQR